MRKALWILISVSALCRCEAQTGWGTVKFSNRNIPTADGNAAYNVPIWAPNSTSVGAGTMPGGATVALFRASDLPDGAPIVSVRLRSDTPQNAAFFSESPTVEIPGTLPGGTTTLVIRAWAGPSYTDTAYRSEWVFTTQPLGGIGPGGDFVTPGLTGWGFEGGIGYHLGPLSIWPWPRITAPTNQSVFSASQQITIHSEVVMESNMGDVVLTNLTLLANDTVLRSQDAPTSPTLDVSVSLAPGQYSLRLVSTGYFRRGSETSPYGPHTSAPVNITVVANWGTIHLSNWEVPNETGNGSYNVPIWSWGTPLRGAGMMPGGVTVAFYHMSDGAPIASVRLSTDLSWSPYFAEFPTVEVPGSVPGATPTLFIRAWAGPSFKDTAFQTSWVFTTKPLGGIRPSDGAVIPTPGLTGWGPGPDGGGFYLGALSIRPWPRITAPANQSVLAASEEITVRGEIVMESNMGEFVLTNLTLLADGDVLRSQNGASPTMTASVNSLAAGTHALRLISRGYLQSGSATSFYEPVTSAPVNITIVAPIEVLLTAAQISNGKVNFNYTATPGLKYVIRNSSDLLDWQPITTNIPSANSAIFSQSVDSAAARYYKVERLPNP